MFNVIITYGYETPRFPRDYMVIPVSGGFPKCNYRIVAEVADSVEGERIGKETFDKEVAEHPYSHPAIVRQKAAFQKRRDEYMREYAEALKTLEDTHRQRMETLAHNETATIVHIMTDIEQGKSVS